MSYSRHVAKLRFKYSGPIPGSVLLTSSQCHNLSPYHIEDRPLKIIIPVGSKIGKYRF